MRARGRFSSQQDFERSLVLFSELNFKERKGFRRTRDLRVDDYSPGHEARLPVSTRERRQALDACERRIQEELDE